MNLHLKAWTGVILTVAVIAGIGGTVANASHHAEHAHSEMTTSKINLDKTKAQGAMKHQRLTAQLFHNSYNSKDPKIRSNAVNYDDNEAVNKPLTRFFKVYYGFDDHESYVNRPKKLTNVATSNVLNDKNLFDNDIGADHRSTVEELQESSDFDAIDTYVVSHKGHKITALANVQYDASEDDHSSVTGKKWFKITYDTSAKKITSVSPIFRVNNIDKANGNEDDDD